MGEDAIDSGGPSREFMGLLLMQIMEMGIFAGSPKAKSLVLDYNGKMTFEIYFPPDILNTT